MSRQKRSQTFIHRVKKTKRKNYTFIHRQKRVQKRPIYVARFVSNTDHENTGTETIILEIDDPNHQSIIRRNSIFVYTGNSKCK